MTVCCSVSRILHDCRIELIRNYSIAASGGLPVVSLLAQEGGFWLQGQQYSGRFQVEPRDVSCPLRIRLAFSDNSLQCVEVQIDEASTVV
jgi:hypothetical protein